MFLKNNDERYEEDKITKWGQDRSFVYQRKYREKRQNVGDYSKEIRRHLTSTQYVMLREQMDPNYKEAIFKRAKFAMNNMYFSHNSGLSLLITLKLMKKTPTSSDSTARRNKRCKKCLPSSIPSETSPKRKDTPPRTSPESKRSNDHS